MRAASRGLRSLLPRYANESPIEAISKTNSFSMRSASCAQVRSVCIVSSCIVASIYIYNSLRDLGSRGEILELGLPMPGPPWGIRETFPCPLLGLLGKGLPKGSPGQLLGLPGIDFEPFQDAFSIMLAKTRFL